MKQRAVYPGSFDPVTFGHMDVVRRALDVFDEVIVAVAGNSAKAPLFTVEERVAMIRRSTRSMRRVRVEAFDGLTVEFARRRRANVIIRGVRMLSDFEAEFQMALTNRRLAPEVETLFLMPSEEHAFISSRLIREAAALGGDLLRFVPAHVAHALARRLGVAPQRSHRRRRR